MAIHFVDLPDHVFPFRIRYFELDASDDDEPLFDVTVDQPGVVQVPGWGRPVRVLIEYADGRVTRYP